MPGVNEKYDEYRYIEDSSDSMVKDIEEAIKIFSSDLTNLKSNILGWDKSIDLKNYTSINNFYTLEWDKIIFWVNNVRNFLSTVYQRLSWMKVQKFWEVSKENNFTWTILAIQIALKAIDSKKYNIKINWKYKDSKDDPTRNAIKQFQIDKKLQWKDGKPGKETIWTLVKELDIFLKNKKLEREENKKLKKDVADIIEESVNFNPYSWLYSREEKEVIVNYILSWKLNSNGDKDKQIKRLSEHAMNWKLKYLIEHSNEPLKNNIQRIKEIEKGRRDGFTYLLKELNTWGSKRQNENIEEVWKTDKYTYWHTLTETQKNKIWSVLSWRKSPVTAKMVADSCKKAKDVPVEYLLWFMQNDSRVWTMWRWARIHNPWNVGPNGGKKDWWTREKWVDACANNLQERINSYSSKINKIKEEFKKYLNLKNIPFNEQIFNSLFNAHPTPEQLATWTLTWTFKQVDNKGIDRNWEKFKQKVLKAFPALKSIPNFKSKEIKDRSNEEFPLIKTLVHGSSKNQSKVDRTLSTPLGWFNRYFWIYMWAPSGPSKVAWMVETRVNRLK